MHFDLWTFALQTINFAILVWLLHRFLYKPILKLIDVRRQEIDKQLADAKAVEQTAKTHLAEIEAQRAQIGTEREQALKSVAQQADELVHTRKAQAEKDAAAVLEDGRRTLAKERDAAAAEARHAAIELASGITRKLIGEMPMERRAEAWLDRVDHYLAELPQDQRSALAAQIADGGAITLVTAAPLPSGAAQEWQACLGKALGAGVVLKLTVDEALIAGVEVHFPQSILRFSLQSVLDGLQSEIERHGDAR